MRDHPAFRLALQASLALLVSSSLCGAAVAATAARVDFTIGDVSATGVDGKQRPIARGAVIESGETVNTAANGRAHLRFNDGGYTSLQPDTQFRIDDFQYSGVTDGQEKGFFSLLKGGLRTITGAIGRNNKSTYRVTTSTATIGVRGTEYLARVTNSLELSVGGGTAELHTQESTPRVFLIPEGTSAFLAGPTAPLQFLTTGLFLPPAPAANQSKQGGQPPAAPGQSDSASSPVSPPPSVFTAGDSRNADGSSAFAGQSAFSAGSRTGFEVISATAVPHAPGTSVNPSFTTAECDNSPSCRGNGGGIVSFDSVGFKRIDCGGSCFIDRSAATVTEIGSVAGVIEWGKWVGGPITAGGFYNNLTFGANQGFNYVAGLPSSPMPISGMGSFSLLGATHPTFSDGAGGGLGTGTMTAGTASVNFLTGSITANMALAFPGGNYSLAMTNGSFQPGAPGLSGSGSLTFDGGSVNVCNYACMASFVGFFAGPNATHLGLGYKAISMTPAVFSINGVAVMQR